MKDYVGCALVVEEVSAAEVKRERLSEDSIQSGGNCEDGNVAVPGKGVGKEWGPLLRVFSDRNCRQRDCCLVGYGRAEVQFLRRPYKRSVRTSTYHFL